MKCVDRIPEYEYCEMENNKIMVFKDSGPFIYDKEKFEEKYKPVDDYMDRLRVYYQNCIDDYNKPKAEATHSSIHKYPPGSNITYICEDDLAPNSIKTHINVMWVFIIIITIYLILSKIF